MSSCQKIDFGNLRSTHSRKSQKGQNLLIYKTYMINNTSYGHLRPCRPTIVLKTKSLEKPKVVTLILQHLNMVETWIFFYLK